jgi:hypothetical protein
MNLPMIFNPPNQGGSSGRFADFDDESRRRDEAIRRWWEQQIKERREKEEEHRRWGEAVKRRNEARKRRPLWQKLLWGDGLSNPGFFWCCCNLFTLMVETIFSIGFGILLLLSPISGIFGLPNIGAAGIAAISVGGTLVIFISIALTYAWIGAWKGLCWILSKLFHTKANPKNLWTRFEPDT